MEMPAIDSLLKMHTFLVYLEILTIVFSFFSTAKSKQLEYAVFSKSGFSPFGPTV